MCVVAQNGFCLQMVKVYVLPTLLGTERVMGD